MIADWGISEFLNQEILVWKLKLSGQGSSSDGSDNEMTVRLWWSGKEAIMNFYLFGNSSSNERPSDGSDIELIVQW